jgi:hypothetical protein
MELLKQRGYGKYDPPVTKEHADCLWQKEFEIGVTEQNMYLNAYEYGPRQVGSVKKKRTVDFQFQLDRGASVRVKLFSFTADELSGRKLDRIEEKARNMFIYAHYA